MSRKPPVVGAKKVNDATSQAKDNNLRAVKPSKPQSLNTDESTPVLYRKDIMHSKSESPNIEGVTAALHPAKIAEIYDERYLEGEDGEQSTYTRRFDRKKPNALGEEGIILNLKNLEVPDRNDETRIAEKVKHMEDVKSGKALDEMKVMTLFDFGCGNGRSLALFEMMADRLKKEGITLRVIAYDISSVGIESYKKKLVGEKFKEMTDAELALYPSSRTGAASPGIAMPEFTNNSFSNSNSSSSHSSKAVTRHRIVKKGNLEVELMSGDPKIITPQILAEEVGEVDMTTAFFGTFSHIFPIEDRDNYLRCILNITRGHVALSAPGKADFQDAQRTYADNPHLALSIGLAKNEVMYHPAGTPDGTLLPYALYTHATLENWLSRAGANPDDIKVSISSWKVHPSKASNSRALDRADYIAAGIGTHVLQNYRQVYDALFESITSSVYYGVTTKGKAGKSSDDSTIVRNPARIYEPLESQDDINMSSFGGGTSTLSSSVGKQSEEYDDYTARSAVTNSSNNPSRSLKGRKTVIPAGSNSVNLHQSK